MSTSSRIATLPAGLLVLLPVLLAATLVSAAGWAGEVGAGPAGAKAGSYVWPCEVPPSLSSGFGEYRPGRFHAGIDLRTNGRTGYRVFAIADGSLYRMRMSPHGYGKALYILTDDGLIAVYAHLSAFVPELTRIAREEQARIGGYSFDLRLERDRIRVERGQLLGWTGQTGIGAPHLHFELRRGEAVPINPQTNGFPVPDVRPPDIEKLLVIPLGPAGRVDGDWAPRALEAGDAAPLVSGTFGLGVKALDRSGFNHHVFAPYLLRLSVDGERIYQRRLETFRYEQNGQIALEYDAPSAWSGEQVILLYRKEGNSLPGREGRGGVFGGPGSGPDLVALEPGRHVVRIEAEDAEGNESHVEYVLRYALRAPGPAQVLPAGNGTGERFYGSLRFDFREDLCRVRLTTDRPLTSRPQCLVSVRGRGVVLRDTFEVETGAGREAGRSFAAVFDAEQLGSSGGPLVAQVVGGPAEGFLLDEARVLPRRPAIPGDPFVAEVEGARLRLGPRTLFEATFVGLSPLTEVPAAGSPELVSPGRGVRIDPPWAALRGEAVLEVSAADSAWRREFPEDKAGLYWYNSRRGGWSYCDNQGHEGSDLRATVRRFGTYAVFADRTPPAIGPLRIDGREVARAGPGSTLVVSIGDGGSGLEEDGIRASLDGGVVIAEWDPERGVLKYEPWTPLEPGSHLLRLEIEDRAGNRAEREYSFMVP